MKKKTIFVLAAILFGLFVGVYGSYAYFTTEEETVNMITAGNLNIQLVETVSSEKNGSMSDSRFQNSVLPGKRIPRIVQVENTGDNPAYVRVRVDKRISLAKGTKGDPDSRLVRYNPNTEAWIDGGDGYYYYRNILEAGKRTEPLFEEVIFDASMGNIYQSSVVQVEVKAQATQVANNGENVMEAKGWPDDDRE